jgi:protein-S-isoprenylcysteine O-methyltransferase Ste14
MRQARSVRWWLARRSRWQILLRHPFSQSTDTKKLVALALLGFAALVFLVLFISYPLMGIVLILLVLGCLALCVRSYNNKKNSKAAQLPNYARRKHLQSGSYSVAGADLELGENKWLYLLKKAMENAKG